VLTSRRRVAVLVPAAVVASALLVTSASATPVTQGFRDFSYGTSASAPTADKPQSKLWFHDGRWWGVLFNSATRRFEIYGFNRGSQDTNAWTSTGTVVEDRRTSQSDARMSGSKLYVVTHLKAGSTNANTAITFKRYGYTAGSAPGTGTYTLETSRTVRNKAVESATVDRDSTGKLWMTWTEDNGAGRRAVFVTHTQATDTDFVTPYVLPAANADNLGGDDISTLVASGGKIGVLYSNQTTAELQFATHLDTEANDRAWTTTTLCRATGCPDDHLNIKDLDGGNGQAFAVVKTSLNDTGGPGSAPLIVLYNINMGGTAPPSPPTFASHTVWTVADDVTRAITVLDKGARDVYVFGAAPCCSGGIIYMKRSAMANPTFAAGLGTPFIQSAQDPKINNPTSTKQSVDGTTGLLVLAGDDSTRFYLHNFLSLGGGTPPPPDTTPPDTAIDSGPSGTVTSTSATFAFSSSEAGSTFACSLDGATASACNSPTTYSSLGPGTHTFTVRATDAAGNTDATPASRTWTIDTSSPPGTIRRESVSTLLTSTASTTRTLSKPAGTTPGDLLVSCLTLTGGSVTAAPAGWSPIASVTGASNPRVFGYYKVATASEPADYTWTTTSVTGSAGIARYSGASGLDGAATSDASNIAATSAALPEVTTTTANVMLVGCMGINSGSTTITAPSGLTQAWELGVRVSELDDGVQATAGASGTKTWTFSASRAWAGWLVGLRPR
jgi:hypothetical protein